MAKAKTRKNIVIAIAMIAVLAVSGIAAYFTATDSMTNNFTIGDVNIEQHEDNFDEDGAKLITSNKEIQKDPTVKNVGDNDAYIFTAVAVPKKVVKVSATATSGTGANAMEAGESTYPTKVDPALDDTPQMTQLFQLNGDMDGSTSLVSGTNLRASIVGQTANGVSSGQTGTYNAAGTVIPAGSVTSNANVWTGDDSWSSGWYLVDVNAKESTSLAAAAFTGEDGKNLLDHYNVYVFAYGSNTTLTKLAPDATTTTPVFESVTFANIIDINDALGVPGTDNENDIDYQPNVELPQIHVKSFAIQADDVLDNTSDAVDPVAVWNVLNNQDGAYRALADELYDLNRDWWVDPTDSIDRTVDNH